MPLVAVVSQRLQVVSKKSLALFIRVLIYYCKFRKQYQRQWEDCIFFNCSVRAFFDSCGRDSLEDPLPGQSEKPTCSDIHGVVKLSGFVLDLSQIVTDCDNRMVIFPSQPAASCSSRHSHLQFSRPDGVDIQDRFALFVVHEDGIRCASQFSVGNEYYCITLEALNVNQAARVHDGMTQFACILQRRKDDPKSAELMLKFLNEYIRTCTITGLEGAFIFHDGMWEHWRWVLFDFCGDLVAENQVVGEAGRMNSNHPCFGKDCERVVVSMIDGGIKNCREERFQKLGRSLVVFEPPLKRFEKDSAYRLLSFIAHCKNPVEFLKNQLFNPSTSQIKEIRAVDSFLRRFPSDSLHQYLPCTVNLDDYWKWRKQEFIKVLGSSELANNYIKRAKETEKEIPVHPEEGFLVPSSVTMVHDFMHSVSNVVENFIQYLTCRASNDNEKYISRFLSKQLWGKDGKKSPFFRPTPEIMQKAKQRMKSLPTSKMWKWLTPEILEPSKFSALKSYERMIFAFALFSWTFQDSMKIPAVFAMKSILDCLSWMFNFDGDYRELLHIQCLLDFFVAMLQSELPPDEIPPTVHNLSHVALSIVLHGCAATNNAYNQESKYRIPKRLCGRNGKPTTTTQIRLVVHNVISLFSLMKKRKEGDYKLYSPMNESKKNGVLSRCPPDVYLEMTKWNALDDLNFYCNDCFSRKTMLDEVVSLIKEKKEEEVLACVRNGCHLEHEKDVITSIASIPFMPVSNREKTVQRVVKDPELQVTGFVEGRHHVQVVCSEANTLNGRCKCCVLGKVKEEELRDCIAFLRLYDGSIACFFVVGYTIEMVNGEYPFYQALCVYLPTLSSVGFCKSQHLVLVKEDVSLKDAFERSNSMTIPISLNRLVFNRVLPVSFNVNKHLLGLSLLKPCIRQCQSIPDTPLFDAILEKGGQGVNNNHPNEH